MTLAKNLSRAASIADLRRMAECNLPRMVFDFIDGASGEEATANRNRAGFGQFLLHPEILVDVSTRSLATTLFGQPVALPIVIAPTGLNGAFWQEGDLCLARAAKAENIPFTMSTAANVTLEAMDAAAGPLRWFQLYMLRDRGLAKALMDRVRATGFEVLQLTVDTAAPGRRTRDILNGFSVPFRWDAGKLTQAAGKPRWAWQMLHGGAPTLQLFKEVLGDAARGSSLSEVMQRQTNNGFSWNDLDWLRKEWLGRLLLKGISSETHARRAHAAGIDGVVVSNHGGRQLDGAGSTIESLPAIVDAVQGRMTVLIDSGFRHGADIAKALALGADGVQLGRSTLYGLAAGGQAGVRQALRILAAELESSMALCGAASVWELRGRVSRAPELRSAKGPVRGVPVAGGVAA